MDHIFLKVFVRNDLTMETTDSLKTIGTCSLFLFIHILAFHTKINHRSLNLLRIIPLGCSPHYFYS